MAVKFEKVKLFEVTLSLYPQVFTVGATSEREAIQRAEETYRGIVRNGAFLVPVKSGKAKLNE